MSLNLKKPVEVVDKNGVVYPARILAEDLKNASYPIAVGVFNTSNGQEQVLVFRPDGSFGYFQLRNKKRVLKREVWYRHENFFLAEVGWAGENSGHVKVADITHEVDE